MSTAQQDYSTSAYEQQLAAKIAAATTLLAEYAPPPATVHASMRRHYRQRVEFRVWHQSEDLFYAMFDAAAPGQPLRKDEFPPASLRINTLMQSLREQLLRTPELRKQLFQAEFLSTLSNQALVTLVYHRPLGEAWIDAARALEPVLDARVIGRSKGQRIVISEPHITEALQLDDICLSQRQPEGCFTQPNADVNRAMLQWARAACSDCSAGLLELYCGIGNFTMALAPCFEAVLATEINKTAIAAARHNLAANAIDNTFVARLASAEVAVALARERPFRRLQALDLDALNARTVLVDPPRAGLDAATCELLGGFDRAIYISCNPLTLARDLRQLGTTHAVERLALFDQFPYTPHLECGVVLQRRHC